MQLGPLRASGASPNQDENQKQAEFEVASLRLNTSGPGPFAIIPSPGGRLRGTNVPAKFLIAAAFGHTGGPLHEYQMVGGPRWLETSRFDVEGKAADNVNVPVLFEMLKSLLQQRWSLRSHWERRELPTYALVMARTDRRFGPQLRRSTIDCDALMTEIGKGRRLSSATRPPYRAGNGTITGNCARISMLVPSISRSPAVRRIVSDETGLDGWFELDLTWAPDQLSHQTPDTPSGTDDKTGLITALQEQLGLRLEARRSSVDVLVIESADLSIEQ
jgi:uncharacterized protein (TIGR03435 family)